MTKAKWLSRVRSFVPSCSLTTQLSVQFQGAAWKESPHCTACWPQYLTTKVSASVMLVFAESQTAGTRDILQSHGYKCYFLPSAFLPFWGEGLRKALWYLPFSLTDRRLGVIFNKTLKNLGKLYHTSVSCLLCPSASRAGSSLWCTSIKAASV